MNKLEMILNKKNNLMSALEALEHRIMLWQNRDREVEMSLREQLRPLENEIMDIMVVENELRLEMSKGSV